MALLDCHRLAIQRCRLLPCHRCTTNTFVDSSSEILRNPDNRGTFVVLHDHIEEEACRVIEIVGSGVGHQSASHREDVT